MCILLDIRLDIGITFIVDFERCGFKVETLLGVFCVPEAANIMGRCSCKHQYGFLHFFRFISF